MKIILCNCSASAQSEFTFHQNPIVAFHWPVETKNSFHQVLIISTIWWKLLDTVHWPATHLTKGQNHRKASHLLCGAPNAHKKRE
jgi:hypothetical protein